MSTALQALRDWLAAHPSPDEPVATWSGGERRTQAGREVVSLPYPDYLPVIDTFWSALEGVPGWSPGQTGDYHAVVERWRAANAIDRIGVEHPARMDRATLLGFLRSIDRGERFCDGHWQDCFRGGLMHAAARALVAMDK